MKQNWFRWLAVAALGLIGLWGCETVDNPDADGGREIESQDGDISDGAVARGFFGHSGEGKKCAGKNKRCRAGLVCKTSVNECHSPSWCRVDDDCLGLVKPEGPTGHFACMQSECTWQIDEKNECESADGYCTHFLKSCEDGYLDAAPMGCPLGRSGKCCLPRPEPKPSCQELSGFDFGWCEMFMGYGVVDGQCQGISGCGNQGLGFYGTMEECQAACESTCGAPRPDHIVIRPDQIAEHAGKKVQVTWPVAPTSDTPMARCTKMACGLDNPCCNRCSANVPFAGDSSAFFTLLGNECDIETSGRFAKGEIITVYGTVTEDGHLASKDVCRGGAQTITVQDERDEYGYQKDNLINPRMAIRVVLDRGPIHYCYMGEWQENALIYDNTALDFFGHNVVDNPNCRGLGCSHEMDEFVMLPKTDHFTSDFITKMNSAPESCYQGEDSANVDDARLFEAKLTTIPCPMYYPPPPDYCAAGHWVSIDNTGDMSHCYPRARCELEVAITFDKAEYAQGDTVTKCVENHSTVSVFLPGCSVFETDGNPDFVCFWEGFAKELRPQDKVCEQTIAPNEAGAHAVGSRFKVTCDSSSKFSACEGFERTLESALVVR